MPDCSEPERAPSSPTSTNIAVSLSIILPVCLVSIAVTAMTAEMSLASALPYLPGSALGGLAAGIWGTKIPAQWLHRGLGILIVWGGIRYLC